MAGWIILGVIVLIIVLIMLIPVGAEVWYEGSSLSLSAIVSGLKLQLFPKEKKEGEQKPREEKPKKEKKPKEEGAEEKPKKKLELNFTTDEILELVKKVLKGLGKLGGSLNVGRFMLHFVAANPDPYNAAMMLGYANGAICALSPLCSQRFKCNDLDVWTDVNFMEQKPKIEIGFDITIRIGQIFGAVNTIVFGALGILIKNRLRNISDKLLKRGDYAPDTEEENTTQEDNKENKQAEERTEK